MWSAPQPDPEPERETVRERPRRARRLFARLTRPLPSPAAVAAVLALVLFAGGAATILAGGETDPMEADPASARGEPAVEAKADEKQQPARARRGERRSGEPRLLRDKTLQPLLAP